MPNWQDGWNQQYAVHVFSDIDQNMCGQTIQQIYGYAEFEKDKPEEERKPITLWINCSGGDVLHTFAMVQAMQACPVPVHTLGLGRVCSAALMLYVAGRKRYTFPNTLFMGHDFSVGNEKFNVLLQKGTWIHDRIIQHFVKYTGIDDTGLIKQRFMKEENYFDENTAIEYIVADEIVRWEIPG